MVTRVMRENGPGSMVLPVKRSPSWFRHMFMTPEPSKHCFFVPKTYLMHLTAEMQRYGPGQECLDCAKGLECNRQEPVATVMQCIGEERGRTVVDRVVLMPKR